MAMTGPELLAYVNRVFKRTDKTTEAYEAMSDMIAQIKYDTKLEAVKEESYIVGIDTLGEHRIALPSDFQNLIGDVTLVDVDGNSNRELKKISKQEYDIRYSDRLYSAVANMHTDEPFDYCIYAKQIYLGPVPDKITYKYQINYTTKDTSEISASTTSVPFTTDYIERNILRAGVLAELYEGMENFEEANYWRAKFLDGKATMIDKDEDNISDNMNVQYNGV